MNSAVIERVKDAEEEQSQRTDDGADDGEDVENGLLLSDGSWDSTRVTKTSFGKRGQDVEGRRKRAEDDEESTVCGTDVRDENDGGLAYFVLGVAVCDPETHQTDNGGCPEAEREDGKKIVQAVNANHLENL